MLEAKLLRSSFDLDFEPRNDEKVEENLSAKRLVRLRFSWKLMQLSELDAAKVLECRSVSFEVLVSRDFRFLVVSNFSGVEDFRATFPLLRRSSLTEETGGT